MEYTPNSIASKALRNIKSLENYVITFPTPKDVAKWSIRNDLIVEIGFGNGELITRMAKARPNDFFLGIESSEISCKKAAMLSSKLGLKNIKFLKGDARFLIREIFPDKSVDLVLAFYPIPWPKVSHSKRRLMGKEFLKSVVTVLKRQGKFVMVTDDDNYLEWTKENLKHLGISFNVHQLRPIKATKYGRKWESFGKKSWSIVAHPRHFEMKRILEGCNVPHAHLKKLELDELEKLSKSKFVDENSNSIVQFKGMYEGKEGYLLKVLSVDGDFPQMFYLLVKRQKDGWLIKLDDTAKVFKTPAVKKSVELAAKRGERISPQQQ